MPSFCFACRKCDVEFYLVFNDGIDYDLSEVFCVECRNNDLQMVAFSEGDEPALIGLATKIANLEMRVRAIEQEETGLDEPLDS